MEIRYIEASGKFAGKKELLAYMNGHPVSKPGSIKARCFECMGGYPDGAMDCLVEACPLLPHMPYRNKQLRKPRVPKDKRQVELFDDVTSVTGGPKTTVKRKRRVST